MNKRKVKQIRNKALKHFEETNDSLASLEVLKKLGKGFIRIYVISYLMLFFCFLFIFYDYIENFNQLLIVSLIASISVYMTIVYLTAKSISKVELTIKRANIDSKQFKIVLKILGLYLVNGTFFLITMIFIKLISDEIVNLNFNIKFVSDLLFLLFCLIVYLLMTKYELGLYKWIFQAKDYHNEDLQQQIQSLTNRSIRLYCFDSHEIKYASVNTLDSHEKSIFISSYLLEHLTLDELKASIVHEVGHIVHRHELKRMIYILTGFVMLLIINLISHFVITNTNLLSTVILTYLFIYFLYFRSQFNQKQLIEADCFCLKNQINKELLVSLPLKLSTLNMINLKASKSESLLGIHPMYQKRIDLVNSF